MNRKTKKTESHDKTGRLKELWVLFYTFLKIGIVCFGGGYAMIGLIEREVVEKKKWLSSEEMLDIIAIAESTPGPISINTSTYIGTKRCGFSGALCSTFGVVLPSFLIIFAISFFLEEFLNQVWIAYAFKGIRVAVLVLILNAVVNMFKKSEKSVFAICVALFTICMCFLTSLSVIYFLLISAAAGIIYNFIIRAVKHTRAAKNLQTSTDNAETENKTEEEEK